MEESKQDGHAYAEYATAEPTIADILPLELFRSAVDAAAADAITSGGCMNLELLTAVFHLTPTEIGRAIAAVTAAARAHPGRPIDAAPALAKAKAALSAKYEARLAAPAVVWWARPTHPAVAREPWPATAAEWYGADLVTADPLCSTALTLDTLLGHIEVSRAGAAVHDGECSLCHEALFRGAPNSLLLGCGHIFHWSGADCPGFLGWVTGGHNDCPVCRRDFHNPRALNGAFSADDFDGGDLRADNEWATEMGLPPINGPPGRRLTADLVRPIGPMGPGFVRMGAARPPSARILPVSIEWRE
jgi:hypothetical protein